MLAPEFIEVEIGSYCNRQCAWCPNGWHDRGQSRQTMRPSVWQPLLEALARRRYRGTFAFHNYNEPLADPQLNRRLEEARAALPRAFLSLYTNGDFLDRPRLTELAALGLNEVLVTLYPSDERAFDPPRPERAIAFLQRLGLRARRAKDKASKLERHARYHGVALTVRVPRIKHYTDRAGSVRLEALQMDAGSVRVEPCFLPFQAAAVDVHGSLKLCCHIYDTKAAGMAPYVIGNVGRTPFFELWESERLEALRRSLSSADFSRLPVCAKCTHRSPERLRARFAGRSCLGERAVLAQ